MLLGEDCICFICLARTKKCRVNKLCNNYYYYYDDEDDDDDDDVELSTGFFPGEKYPVKSHPETSDFQHFSEDICRSEECRLLHRSCSVLNS